MPSSLVSLNPLERCCDMIADYVEKHPALSNADLNQMSKALLAQIVKTPQADICAAMILSALVAVRDAPDALRGDQQLPSEGASNERVALLKGVPRAH